MKKYKLLQELEQAIFNVIADYHDIFTLHEMAESIRKMVKIAFGEFYEI